MNLTLAFLSLSQKAYLTVQRARVEAKGLARCCYPHGQNNTTRKGLTLLMFATWMVITVGHSFGYASIATTEYMILTVLVFTIFGRQWGIEVERLMGVDLNGGDDE